MVFKKGEYLGFGFKKGNVISHKEGCSCFRCHKGQIPKHAFVKGQEAYNKGIPMTLEQKRKNSISHIGIKHKKVKAC